MTPRTTWIANAPNTVRGFMVRRLFESRNAMSRRTTMPPTPHSTCIRLPAPRPRAFRIFPGDEFSQSPTLRAIGSPYLFGPGPPGVNNVPDNKPRRSMHSESEIEIREATTEDAADIQRLARELAETVGDAPPLEGAVRKRLEELLETPRARVLVLENGRRVVGAASLWIKPDLAHGDAVVEVPMLVVAEDHRRTGVGRLLMEEVRSI